MTDNIQILLISGSIRHISYTRTLAKEIESSLKNYGAKITHWNLRRKQLPIADPKFHSDPLQYNNELVRSFVSLADSCDAFVLASPIYHNSYSGVLKNALDHLTIKQFFYKPVGLISHGGNRSPQAVDHLRIVTRGLMGVAIPTQVCTSTEDYQKTEAGKYYLDSENINARIGRFITELVLFAYQFRLIRRNIT